MAWISVADRFWPADRTGRITLPVAGDDPRGRRVAAELTNVTGFDALDIGGLENSWRVQPGTAAYCTELPLDALRAAVEQAERDHAPTRRDLSSKAFATFDTGFTRRDVVRFHRAVTRTPDPA